MSLSPYDHALNTAYTMGPKLMNAHDGKEISDSRLASPSKAKGKVDWECQVYVLCC